MKLFRNILRVLSTLAVLSYAFIFIDEVFPPYDPNLQESNFGIVMVVVLFIWFSVGYSYLWKNEKMAGLFFITWWIGLFLTAWLIWLYGNVTVILGLPIFVIGILLLVYAHKKDVASHQH
ncbi:hypothetical protein [Marinoscillum sp. MHG1-6]|uniref:hypothetical protein n=1 Tax=Marinoscillum sp. MHG1-6 TaxID=2959627 RepID=UPI0021578E20|nr:hypothetical protein [Marinoscillum sp. MHG1-6]